MIIWISFSASEQNEESDGSVQGMYMIFITLILDIQILLIN